MNNQQVYFPGTEPVSTDDLIFQIGEKEIDLVRKRKAINNFKEQTDVLIQTNKELNEKLIELEELNKELLNKIENTNINVINPLTEENKNLINKIAKFEEQNIITKTEPEQKSKDEVTVESE